MSKTQRPAKKPSHIRYFTGAGIGRTVFSEAVATKLNTHVIDMLGKLILSVIADHSLCKQIASVVDNRRELF
jgi:hypothetical protein